MTEKGILQIEWTDFQKSGGARANICVRMLVGDQNGNNERYAKTWFTIATAPIQGDEGGHFEIVMDGDPSTAIQTSATTLDEAKSMALKYHLPTYISSRWLSELFGDAEQISLKSGIA